MLTVKLLSNKQVVDDVFEGYPMILVLDHAGNDSLFNVALGLKNFKYVHRL